MNLDYDKARELLKIFSKLNQDNQKRLLVNAFEMEFEQNLRRNLNESGEPDTEENLDAIRASFLDAAKPVMKHWDDMGPNFRAALAILMNDLTKGKLTKEEHIDFVVSSRQLSISEYIEKYIPSADIEEAKKIYQSFKKTIYHD